MEWIPYVTPSSRAAVVTLARLAVDAFPDREEAWIGLAEALLSERQPREAADVLDSAGVRFPTSVDLHVMSSRVARALEDWPASLSATAAAIELAPRDACVIAERVEGLVGTGQLDVALAIVEAAGPLPIGAYAQRRLSAALIGQGRAEAAVVFAQECVNRTHGSAHAVYHLGTTLVEADRVADARTLIDRQRFTRSLRPALPPGFSDPEMFRRALRSEIERNPTLTTDPDGTTTRHGLQTTRLPQDGDTALNALLETLAREVDSYASSLDMGDQHPFVQHRPARVRMDAWAVVYPEKGRQDTHIHPSGWLSGVYYVAVPAPQSDVPDGGSLVLGGFTNGGEGHTAPWGIGLLRPSPGDLIVFPSWLPHSTRPTGASDRRICVSFDVIPERV